MNTKALLLLILFAGTVLNQPLIWIPSQVWSTNFNFGGQTDQIARMLIYQNNVFAVGWYSGTLGTLDGSASFNLLNGSNNWLKVGTNPSTLGGLQFAVCANKVFFWTGGGGGNFLNVRDVIFGNLVLSQPIGYGMSMLQYGDSIIAVTHESSSRVIVLNSNGVMTRQFTLGYNLNQGMLTLRKLGENIWVNGYFFANGQPNFFVEKRNLFSGNLVWRHEIIKAIRCYSDIDAQGNCYIGANLDSISSSNKWWFLMMKIDADKNQQWLKIWTPNQLNAGENTISGLAVSPKNDIVLLVGTSNVGTPPNNFYKGYMYGRNVTNGDSIFALLVQRDQNGQAGLRDVAFDTSGSFSIIGTDGGSPRTLFVRRYKRDTLVGVINPGGEVPQGFKLCQNYPNPFNPLTTIGFSIPKKMLVNVKVYDALGKEVQILVNQEKPAGNYEVNFDGSNLPSGVYYYRIMAGDYMESKKMVLIK